MLVYIRLSFLLLCFVALTAGEIQAQKSKKRNKREPVQFSGLIVTADSLLPVPYANILIKNTHRGTISDFSGFFSLVALKGDTIIFSSIGYKPSRYIIPDTLSGNKYSLFQIMTKDTIWLKETVIYPWPTYEQFKRAFVEMEIPEDDYDRAMRNLALSEMKNQWKVFPMDGSMNYKNWMDRKIYDLSYAGQYKPSLTSNINNPLLDPFAWIRFFKAWKEGKLKIENYD